jgi:hypothetical protein
MCAVFRTVGALRWIRGQRFVPDTLISSSKAEIAARFDREARAIAAFKPSENLPVP